jgi:uncharacterized membrane protein YidH (DUF202 family)
LHEDFGLDPIEGGEILIEEDLVPAEDDERAGDIPDWRQVLGTRHERQRLAWLRTPSSICITTFC